VQGFGVGQPATVKTRRKSSSKAADHDGHHDRKDGYFSRLNSESSDALLAAASELCGSSLSAC
jgi:hypothetical protein